MASTSDPVPDFDDVAVDDELESESGSSDYNTETTSIASLLQRSFRKRTSLPDIK